MVRFPMTFDSFRNAVDLPSVIPAYIAIVCGNLLPGVVNMLVDSRDYNSTKKSITERLFYTYS